MTTLPCPNARALAVGTMTAEAYLRHLPCAACATIGVPRLAVGTADEMPAACDEFACTDVDCINCRHHDCGRCGRRAEEHLNGPCLACCHHGFGYCVREADCHNAPKAPAVPQESRKRTGDGVIVTNDSGPCVRCGAAETRRVHDQRVCVGCVPVHVVDDGEFGPGCRPRRRG